MKEIFKYGIVGILNTIVGIITIYGLMSLGINYLLSNAAAYILGLFNSFLWNKFWTFRNKTDWNKQFCPFLIAFIMCYLVQLFSVFWGTAVLGISKHLMQIIGMAVFTVLNFNVNKFVVFKINSEDKY